MRLQWW